MLGFEDGEIAARFRLNMRCHNCKAKSCQIVDVPHGDDAPTDVDSFLGSAMVERLPFKCVRCDNVIASILTVSPVSLN